MGNKELSEKGSSEHRDYLSVLRDFEHRIEDKLKHLWNKPFSRDSLPDIESYGGLYGMPRMDVIDREKELFVRAELPGFEKKDLDISISDNQLVIKASSSQESKEEDGDFLRREISTNEIYRSIRLPAEVEDDGKIKTSYKKGILELTIPKHKKSHRRKIEVE